MESDEMRLNSNEWKELGEEWITKQKKNKNKQQRAQHLRTIIAVYDKGIFSAQFMHSTQIFTFAKMKWRVSERLYKVWVSDGQAVVNMSERERERKYEKKYK